MAKQQKKNVKKAGKAKVKKKWHPIVAPKSFNSMTLGESHVADAQLLKGKTVTVNLMHLTNDMRNQGVEIKFVVTQVKDGAGYTVVTGYEVLPSQMKRIVRRGRSKVMDSFIVRVGKEQLVRIKPMVFTANRASKGAQTAIRLTVRERVKQLLAQTTFDQLVQDLIQHKLQRSLKEAASKHHPIKNVEIKACFLLPQKANASTPDIQETAEDKKEQVTEDLPVDDREDEAAQPAEETAPAENSDAPAESSSAEGGASNQQPEDQATDAQESTTTEQEPTEQAPAGAEPDENPSEENPSEEKKK